MKRNVVLAVVLAILVCGFASGAAVAQDEKPKNASAKEGWTFYKLDFVVRELEDGKSVSTRNYTIMTRSNDWQQLRVGTRVPVLQGKTEQFQYVDVGLQVDCRIFEEPGRDISALSTKAEITSFAVSEQEKQVSSSAPLIRRVQMQTTSPLTFGKPMIISGADELGSKHRFQLEVTATQLK